MDNYNLIKTLHVACAAISVSGFVVRGMWMFSGSGLLRHKLTRVLPHAVDALLLLSALWLLVLSGQHPTGRDWLTAKLVAIVLYIVVGSVALKRGRTALTRALAFVVALGVFAYIVVVALARQPWPFG
ncbi:MAG TPA: regulator SirB [Gammaproteobacteria bacterium]|mgnify:FL=1|jgi:uncharacterized membrane protein SirB2|nr:SirB2 family protein [Arenicellales bacterium]HCY12652.1 regulator SirB [Gammaproteobacteria bacterium]|tara:strand:+ start:2040 stop:2423 length:384 start_codon:yes stop_codon:yes gene_type:complete